MKVLVVGGAGYIGSHCVYELCEQGHEVYVIDNLQTGHLKAIHEKAHFFEGDIRDETFLDSFFDEIHVDGVIHFAANSLVQESMKNPIKYFNNNVHGTEVLLRSMCKHNILKIVFSSTAAVYGEPKRIPIMEEDDTCPKNPYGESKLMMEKMMKWCDDAYNLKYVSLRYFNVAGAHHSGLIGEDHNPETHLIPLILQVPLGKKEKIVIFGNDYDTKDGTCIRDYIQIEDLISAHIKALEYLMSGNESNIFNLGSEHGYSNLEMVEVAKKVTGKDINTVMGERREGDPAKLIASSEKAKKILGWTPKYQSIEDIIASAWKFHCMNPNGLK